MVYLQLLKREYQFSVGTSQILQLEFLNNNTSELIMFFEDHVQMWNIDVGKKLYSSLTSPSIYFWSVPVPIGPTSFAFVSLENCEPTLGAYNFVEDKIEKLCKLPDEQENYSKTFYFEDSKEIAIDARGKEHRLLVWNGKSIEAQKLDDNEMVEKYNNETIAIFSINNRITGFKLQKSGFQSKSFHFSEMKQGTIISVQQYSSTEAIIAIVNGKNSSVILYSLLTGRVLKQERFDFQIDNLVRLADFWVGICTTEQEGDSKLKVQACFGKEYNMMIEVEINRWIRYWNDYIPIITVCVDVENEQKQIVAMEIVKCAPKRSMYIKLLEKAGFQQAFGDEIVKATINNF